MPETPEDHDDAPAAGAEPGPVAHQSRLITRWIGTGIGAALLITVMSLAFARSCITSAQAHVMAVVLALGAALLLWGVVGGLKVDVKLKFKALGEVTAAGVAGIFLVVHFVSADGIISSSKCDDDGDVKVLYGRVFLQGAETRPVAGAKVKVELEEIETRTTDEDGHFDIIVKGEVPRIRVWVQKPGFYESVPVDESIPLEKDKIRIPMVKLVPKGDPRPPVRDFPTFVREWDEPLVKATDEDFDRAVTAAKGDPLEAVNWARRAHAAGKWEKTKSFFDLAKDADPSGRTWFTDQGYLASAYRELGRVEDAKAVRSAVEEAVKAGDPRIDPDWYRVTVDDLDLYSARTFGKTGGFEPKVGEGRVPGAEPIRPGVEPKPRPTTEPGQPTAQPVQPTTQPGVEPKPVQPTTQPVQPTTQPVQPVQPTTQPVQPTVQPVQPTTQPVQPTTQPVQPLGQPVQPRELGGVEPGLGGRASPLGR